MPEPTTETQPHQAPNAATSSHAADTADTAAQTPNVDGSIKETFMSLIISFVMALVFRSFVVEAFVIPTGSMAPTLLGAHMHFKSPQTGYAWDMNPWYEHNEMPLALQGAPPAQYGPPTATDPITTSRINPMSIRRNPARVAGYVSPPQVKPIRAGDRILVEKYLYELFPPSRWDVVVFKNPELVTQNFIKRLVGLPNEQLWIVDGDIFTRRVTFDPDGNPLPAENWHIQPKTRKVQRALWRHVYSSEYAPIDPKRNGGRWFTQPWTGDAWSTTENGRAYRHDDPGQTSLQWNSDAWPVWDWVPYNEFPLKLNTIARELPFPVSDVRMKAGVKPDTDGLALSATISTRGHQFQALLDAGVATLRMRPITPGSASGTSWTVLATAPHSAPKAKHVTDIEFWHADQTLRLVIDGKEVLTAQYDWSPSQRLFNTTGYTAEQFASPSSDAPSIHASSTYAFGRPELSWTFTGAPVTLYRVGLDRDIYYEPAGVGMRHGLGTHPNRLTTLGPDHFFVLGDNSPSSKDGRLWDSVDDPVRVQIDDAIGVVHRKMMLGRAVFVYFPAPHTFAGRIPIPDFGKMRFIW